jgi:predicted Holliday junction resolvase-like endonuclease
MTAGLMHCFRDVGYILAVCPRLECRELFYLSDARVHLDGERPTSIIDMLRAAERRLDRDEEMLLMIEDELRRKAAEAGKRIARKSLKRIDPVFSGAGYDPQDVKVIFDPVPYVLFDGMCERNLKQIVFVANPPEDGAAEEIQSSLIRVIDKGNIEFKTLHVSDDGQVLPR